MKLLFTITSVKYEKKYKKIYKNYKLPFVISLNCYGSASKSMMSYFEIDDIKKILMLSIVSDDMLDDILIDINKITNIPGSGIAFSTPINSGPKYLEKIVTNNKKGDEVVVKTCEYSLIVTIVSSGYAQTVMDEAKKCGASGGTLINGRGLGSNEAIKFLGVSIEPEKDIVLNVVKNDIKNKVMQCIVESCGINTPGKGVSFSLPIDKVVGFGEMDAKVKKCLSEYDKK